MLNSNYPPKRGFTSSEFETRLIKAHKIMHKHQLDVLLLTMPANIRYFSGFDTQFLHSPTRPWFLVIPFGEEPIAVIPEIGKSVMQSTWIKNISTWHSPNPKDDGISLLSSIINEKNGKNNRVGAELGREMSLRMPLIDFNILKTKTNAKIVDGTPAIWEVRMTKTEAEITHINHICKITSQAYNDLPNFLRIGETEKDAADKLKMDIIRRGADTIPYMPVVSGENGISQIISGPSDRVLSNGDVLFIDTGSTYDGYFCDFDRNFAIGKVSDTVSKTYELLWEATEAGINAAIPGATTGDIWKEMNKVIESQLTIRNNVGRLGHGLGLQLTEPPSHTFNGKTKILKNMVLTIEPGIEYLPGKTMVHEENIFISDDGPVLLTIRAQKELPKIN